MMSYLQRVIVLTFCIVVLTPLQAFPDSSFFGSDYNLVQTAGFAGLIAAGFGWEFGTSHEINGMVGYVPERVTGFELWQITTKYEYHPFASKSIQRSEGGRIKPSPIYFGFGLIYGRSDRLFLDNNPRPHPGPKYDRTTALRGIFNVGTAFSNGGSTVYIEYSALATGVLAYYRDQEWFQDNYGANGLEGFGSLGFGLKFYFNG